MNQAIDAENLFGQQMNISASSCLEALCPCPLRLEWVSRMVFTVDDAK